MKRVIRLGDPTSHGGVVISAAPKSVLFDKPVARVGDKVTCPIKGHGTCPIVEGDPTWLVDGKAVALEGHKTACGAALISTMPQVGKG
ncbi:PAAR domain-containing protein [Chitinibacter fontanus]|uniref:PAAR domain-containing protein n=1 Tax=Chitinibacter fontanus TaxID=1737446 RepID=A0A7D5Z5D7_9NEIS|nr:PAAR domain-containing protein [Chitinibacter fontanus]QLI81303.1 PAAR domain-containing protein [Chitinibacter fontanus]